MSFREIGASSSGVWTKPWLSVVPRPRFRAPNARRGYTALNLATGDLRKTMQANFKWLFIE